MWVIIKIVMHEYSISEGCIRLCGNCRNVGWSLAMLRTDCINNYLDISVNHTIFIHSMYI